MKTLVKLGISLIALVLALIPFWIYLASRHLFAPKGFWQNLVLAGLGLWLGGGIQIVFLITLIAVLYCR